MGEYRHRTTGEVKSQGAWRSDYPNTSFPAVWSKQTLDYLQVDPVFTSPAATTKAYEISVRDGVEQDSKGNWVEKYVARDMFADTTETDEDGKKTTTTKSQHEAAYQATLDAATAVTNRATRDAKLAETDWHGMSDVTMSSEMTTYRQALRDLPAHSNWPNLEDADWPTKP